MPESKSISPLILRNRVSKYDVHYRGLRFPGTNPRRLARILYSNFVNRKINQNDVHNKQNSIIFKRKR